MMKLAMYKGPPPPDDWAKHLSHFGIRLWFLSAYSHSEIVGSDGWCYGSSARDRGVRRKQIDLRSGRWDLFVLPGADEDFAMRYFAEREGRKYDYKGAAAYPFPFIKHSPDREFCFELNAGMLRLPDPHRTRPIHLTNHALHLYAVNHLGVCHVDE